MQPLELTLIVAATRNMGIGANGTMPWKGLRKEMQYFARVTTRLPSQAAPNTMNAVIMGRKTWDSIPPKFRPLKDRLNIVVTRSAAASASTCPSSPSSPFGPVKVSSLELALQYARSQSAGRVFVMGGAQIYDAALKLSEARRVLLTAIQRDFDCDVFFPLHLTPENHPASWAQRSREALLAWNGEDGEVISPDGQEEAGTRYEFQMWEKSKD